MLTGCHQVGLEGAKRSLVGMSIFVAELIPASPPAGADHVQTGLANLSEIAIPHVDARVFKVQALNIAGHVGCSDNRQGSTIQFEVVSIHAEARTRAQIGFISYPEARAINSANLLAVEQLSLDDVEALCIWS